MSKFILADCHIGSNGIECFDISYPYYIPENVFESANKSINNLLFIEKYIELVLE